MFMLNKRSSLNNEMKQYIKENNNQFLSKYSNKLTKLSNPSSNTFSLFVSLYPFSILI